MDRFLLSGKQGINIQEMKKFREIVKKLVAESGVDLEFPEETKQSTVLKWLIWTLQTLAALMAIFGFVFLFLGVETGFSIFELMIGVLFVGVRIIFAYGLLLIIIPTVILYRDEQKQFRLELRTLIDIAEAAISVLRNQRRKSMNSKINQAEKLIKEYRKYKL